MGRDTLAEVDKIRRRLDAFHELFVEITDEALVLATKRGELPRVHSIFMGFAKKLAVTCERTGKRLHRAYTRAINDAKKGRRVRAITPFSSMEAEEGFDWQDEMEEMQDHEVTRRARVVRRIIKRKKEAEE